MGISIGLVGLGMFGQAFADLFRSHPLVDRVALCDREPERMDRIAERPGWDKKFDPKDRYETLDDLLVIDLDAIAIITQPWLHAPQCRAVMESGKHVYSAVPILTVPDGDEIMDWCYKLVETSMSTGQYYMLGETSYYHPQSMFCRRKAAAGAFGDFVYCEGEYMHDVDAWCNLREVEKNRTSSRSGREWVEYRKKYIDAGIKTGPMHYPTHSVSGPISVMNARAKKVVCYGFTNRTGDSFFDDMAFTNETALFEIDNGSTLRICEFRELAGTFHDGETFRIVGTRGVFNEDMWKENFRTATEKARDLETTKLSVLEMRDPLPEDVALAFAKIGNPEATSFEDFTPEGHGGSHPYLVNEFVAAIAGNRQPTINIWEAAHYMAMGVMAHKSALKDGERLDIPDFGRAPA